MSNSLLRISNLLNENGHEIVDIWIRNNNIEYIRVISREKGHLFFLKVDTYELEYNENICQSSSIYYLEDIYTSSENDNLLELKNICEKAFIDVKNRYLLQNGCYIYNGENIYHVKNLPISDRKGLYVMIPLEWFYENRFVITFDIEKLLTKLYNKFNIMIEQFIPTIEKFSNFIEIDIIKKIQNYYNELNKKKLEHIDLYIKICKGESETIQDINYNDKLSHNSDITFQDTIRRTHQNKILHDKLDKYIILRKKIESKILFYYQEIWQIIIKIIYIIYKFTIVIKEFKSLILEIETILPISNIIL